MSDGSMRSAELWNDGPAFQAALGQMQQFQAQMQQQLQDQLAQIQLQVGSLQHTVQAACSQAVPAWPPQQIPPQMPLQHAGQAPTPKRTKVRAGRLGRRERAEVKAAHATRQAEQKSEGSEAEASEDSWLLDGAAEGVQERQEKKIGAAALRQLMEAFGQGVKAEMEESRWETKEAFGQRVKAEMETGQNEAKESYERTVSAATQQLTEDLGQMVKVEMEESRREAKEAYGKMASEAVERMTTVVYELEAETDDALARLRTDLKAGVSDTVDAAVEAAVASIKSFFEDALGRIESERASQQADWELTAETLERNQCSIAAELRGQVEDGMRSLADKLDALELSLQRPRPASPSLHAPQEGMRGPADRTDAPELSVQGRRPDMPSPPAPSSEPSPQTHQGLEGAAAPALPGCRSAEAGGASRPQDSPAAQRDGAPRDVADSFDPSRLGGTMRLTESAAVASLAACSGWWWSTVCGKHVVAGPGKYAWQLKIENSPTGGRRALGMIVGILPAYSGDVVGANLHSKGGFGYIATYGRKTTRAFWEPYGPACDAGDVVTVVLDLTSCELSFKKNRQDLGVSHRVPAGEYCLAVSMSGRVQSVRILASGPA